MGASNTYREYIALVVLAAICVVAVPLVLLLLLLWSGKERRKPGSQLYRLAGALFAKFKDRMPIARCWEVLRIGRKVGLITVGVFVDRQGAAVQMLHGMFILSVSVLLLAWVKPYKSSLRLMNWFEALSLFAILTTCIFGLIEAEDESSAGGSCNTPISWLAVVVILLHSIFFICCLLSLAGMLDSEGGAGKFTSMRRKFTSLFRRSSVGQKEDGGMEMAEGDLPLPPTMEPTDESPSEPRPSGQKERKKLTTWTRALPPALRTTWIRGAQCKKRTVWQRTSCICQLHHQNHHGHCFLLPLLLLPLLLLPLLLLNIHQLHRGCSLPPAARAATTLIQRQPLTKRLESPGIMMTMCGIAGAWKRQQISWTWLNRGWSTFATTNTAATTAARM